MARTWRQIRVDVISGCGTDCDPPPGRIFIVGPGHTYGRRSFEDLEERDRSISRKAS
jgi:hypothetical protein